MENILKGMLATLALIVDSEIVVKWFVLTTICTTIYAMKANHLNFYRWLKYAILFFILMLGINGPIIHYTIVVMHKPINTASIWTYPTFIFSFFTCLMIGVTLGWLLKTLRDYVFNDFWLSMATFAYHSGEKYLKRSKAFRALGIDSIEGLHELAIKINTETVTTDFIEKTV